MDNPCIDHGLRGNKPGGYHQRSIGGTFYYVHRLAYAEAHDLRIEDVPPLLRHTCDNPRCVNPTHLLPGTHQDNANDRNSRNRQAKGEQINTAKLTADQVRGIRMDQRSRRVVAAAYGISKNNLAAILTRQTWKHI